MSREKIFSPLFPARQKTSLLQKGQNHKDAFSLDDGASHSTIEVPSSASESSWLKPGGGGKREN